MVRGDVFTEDRDQLVGQEDRPLRAALGVGHDDGRAARGLNEVRPSLDVLSLGPLDLSVDGESAAHEVDVADLDAKRLTHAKAGEGAQRCVGTETDPR